MSIGSQSLGFVITPSAEDTGAIYVRPTSNPRKRPIHSFSNSHTLQIMLKCSSMAVGNYGGRPVQVTCFCPQKFSACTRWLLRGFWKVAECFASVQRNGPKCLHLFSGMTLCMSGLCGSTRVLLLLFSCKQPMSLWRGCQNGHFNISKNTVPPNWVFKRWATERERPPPPLRASIVFFASA